MLHELPENWGTSVKAFAHCPTDPGSITRTPGRCSSAHFDVRYSIVLLRSCGEKNTLLANRRWLTTCSPAIARTRNSSAARIASGILSIHRLAEKTTRTESASSISFLYRLGCGR